MLRAIVALLVVAVWPAHLSHPSHPSHHAPTHHDLRTQRTRRSLETFDFSTSVRVDYFHDGGPRGEAVTLDAMWREGEWAGSRTQLIDPSGLGNYLFEVDRREVGPGHLFARLRVDLRRMGDDAGVPHGQPKISRIAAIPVACRAGARGREEARRRERISASLAGGCRGAIGRVARAARRSGHFARGKRPAGSQGRLCY